jgi:DNA-binding SARP family transcriptional activator
MSSGQVLGNSDGSQRSMLPARMRYPNNRVTRVMGWLLADPRSPFPRTWAEGFVLPFYLLTMVPAIQLVLPTGGAPWPTTSLEAVTAGLVVGLLGLAYPTRRLAVVLVCLYWIAVPVLVGGTNLRTYGLGSRFLVELPFLAVAAVFVGLCIWADGHLIRARSGQRMAAQRTDYDEPLATFLAAPLASIRAQIPVTMPGVTGTTTLTGLRAGEVTRHFDSRVEGAINGMLAERTLTRGWQLGGNSFIGSVRTRTEGNAWVQLGVQGSIREDLTNDSFTAVLERSSSSGPDVVRLIVPSAGAVHDYVRDLIWNWQRGLQINSRSELAVRVQLDDLADRLVCDASYVADRLGAIRRTESSNRPKITVVGASVNEHALLAGAIQFGPDGHWYQLFPIALVNAIADLMNGRLPSPSPPTPPSLLAPEPEPGSATGSAPDQAVVLVAPNGELDLEAPVQEPNKVAVSTLGHFRLAVGNKDLTNDLLQKPVASFLWIYTMSRAVRNPKDAASRAALADEVFPNLDPKLQRTRVRQRLSDMQGSLPLAISRCLVADGERVRFDLAACTIDVVRLHDWATAIDGARTVLDQGQLNSLEELAESIGDGIFLPEWEALEAKVTAGQSSAGTVVETLRADVDRWRATVLIAIADAHAARGRPAQAVAYLERVNRSHPDNELATKKLIAAYLETGQADRARALQGSSR